MELLEAIILGLVQGLTEFLPVSSSGHLVIAKEILGVDINEEAMLTFGVVVHSATVLATITVFGKTIGDLLKGLFKFKYNEQTKYLFMIAVSMIPVMVVGLFFKSQVEAFFGEGLMLVGAMLLITSALLTLSYFLTPKNPKPLTYSKAFGIGIAQAVAVLPGISRSGATISTGLLLGIDKKKIAAFSFLMVLVPILGEAFLELLDGKFSPDASGISTMALIGGFLTAYASGLFACKVMINIVAKGKLYWFAIYCALLGAVTLIYA
ncbi:Undecaprenyl-diphosphatase [Mucinivorans hirudinis]|uniref:Undecaprenyl-diphosphatase n=1 Tax=Mucinivorans hirudinis TaxID=1433126 RepID=A0A060RBK0_9BACT|nr:Undecaprenyl-diphosphatase [Mucinivorans hirudinis]